MEAHRSSCVQRSSLSQLSTPGASGTLSSSLPVYVSTFEESYPSLPNSQLLYMQGELNANPMAFYSCSTSNTGVVGHMFSSTPGLSDDFHFFSVGPPENHSRMSPFPSQLSNVGASLPLTTCRSVMLQSTPLNNSGSRFTDPLADFLDCPVNTPIEINQVGRNNSDGCHIPIEGHSKRNHWRDWEDQLINDDNSLISNWNDLFVESNVEDPQPKVIKSSSNFLAPYPQVLQIPTSSGQSYSTCSLSGALTRQRIRWTLEIHEAFVEAVTKLGGPREAKSRDIMKLMKVEGLTQCQVRSHLQKYRDATDRRIPESSEGASEKRLAPIQEVSSPDLKMDSEITTALRVQMELQKCLHEQLEVMESSPNFLAPYPEVLQIPTSSGLSSSTCSPSGASTRQRMRWTLELHEAFVEAVTKLGGPRKATPKDIVDLMKVEGLEDRHVKSHLQKYREATDRRIPESSEGASEKRLAPIQEVSSPDLKMDSEITTALRVQMELQKCLHEQLEIQRNLQLRVEEQGKYLQRIYENQCKGASTSSLINISPQRRHAIPAGSLDRNDWGASWVENEGRESDGVIDMTASVRVSRKLGEKQKASVNEAYEDPEKMLQGQVPDQLSEQKRMKGPLIPQTIVRLRRE